MSTVLTAFNIITTKIKQLNEKVSKNVSVSSQAKNQKVSSQSQKILEGLGLDLVSDRKPNVSVSSSLWRARIVPPEPPRPVLVAHLPF